MTDRPVEESGENGLSKGYFAGSGLRRCDGPGLSVSQIDQAAARVRAQPDFWLNEAKNVLWLQVRRRIFTPDEAGEALFLLKAQIDPTPAANLNLHELALEIGIEVTHSTSDTLYLAFLVAMGAKAAVVADG